MPKPKIPPKPKRIAYVEVTALDDEVYVTRVTWDYGWTRRRIEIDPDWSPEVVEALAKATDEVERRLKMGVE